MEISKIKQELLADAVVDESTGLDSDLRGKLNGLNSVGTEPDAPKVRLSLNDVKEYVETGPGQKSDRLATLNELLKVDEEIAGKNQYSLYSTKARAFIQSQSAIPALGTGDVGTTYSPGSASVSGPSAAQKTPVKAAALSEDAERAGFSIETFSRDSGGLPAGTIYLSMPVLGNNAFIATLPTEPSAADVFTQLDFDQSTQTLTFATSRGEKGYVNIDLKNRQVTVTATDPDGNPEPTMSGEYIPNGNLARSMSTERQYDSYANLPQYNWDATRSQLTATYSDGRTENVPVNLPKGFEIHVVDNRMVMIEDTIGPGGFSSGLGYPGWGSSTEGRAIFVVGEPRDLTIYTGGKFADGSSADYNFEKILPGLEREALRDDCRKKDGSFTLNGHTVAAQGPNRNGEYHLVSEAGGSAIWFDPNTQTVRLDEGFGSMGGWGMGNETCVLGEFDASTASFEVTTKSMIYPNGGPAEEQIKHYKIEILLDNRDSRKACRVIEIKD